MYPQVCLDFDVLESTLRDQLRVQLRVQQSINYGCRNSYSACNGLLRFGFCRSKPFPWSLTQGSPRTKKRRTRCSATRGVKLNGSEKKLPRLGLGNMQDLCHHLQQAPSSPARAKRIFSNKLLAHSLQIISFLRDVDCCHIPTLRIGSRSARGRDRGFRRRTSAITDIRPGSGQSISRCSGR